MTEIFDRDICASAKRLLDQHGLEGTSEHCADRIQALGDVRDKAGIVAWGRIRAALMELSDIRFEDATTH